MRNLCTDRADVEDVAVLGLLDVRDAMLGDQEGAANVDLVHEVEPGAHNTDAAMTEHKRHVPAQQTTARGTAHSNTSTQDAAASEPLLVGLGRASQRDGSCQSSSRK